MVSTPMVRSMVTLFEEAPPRPPSFTSLLIQQPELRPSLHVAAVTTGTACAAGFLEIREVNTMVGLLSVSGRSKIKLIYMSPDGGRKYPPLENTHHHQFIFCSKNPKKYFCTEILSNVTLFNFYYNNNKICYFSTKSAH